MGTATPIALRQGLAGALGGLLVFLLLEPHSNDRAGDSLEAVLWNTFLLGCGLGAVLAACLTLFEELSSGSALRVVLRTTAASMSGAAIGLASSIFATILFNVVRMAALFGGDGLLVIARTLAWAAFGMGVGITSGLISRSVRRVLQGAAGGGLGGFIGGIAFDTLGQMTGSGTTSRLVGFVVVGLSVGLATALVEQLSRVAWLTFLTGSREGRHVVLHRDECTLGRDELADVPLFGDPAIARRHAVLTLRPKPWISEIGPASLLRVDGASGRTAALTDGAIVEIGRHRFRFHLRVHQRGLAVRSAPEFPHDVTLSMPAPMPACESRERYAYETTGGRAPRLGLRHAGGPGGGGVTSLPDSGLTIGREEQNLLQLTDPKISRFHARIDAFEQAWILTDLESTNGTRLNGMRVRRAGLQPGDHIYLGDSVLTVIELE